MPRNGSGIYSLPSGSVAVDGETIEASTHNTPIQDLATDANEVRPITAGGTGAGTAADARTNLGAAESGGVIVAAVGSVSEPGFSFTGDTDTGFYRIAGGSIGFATNGDQRAIFNALGTTINGDLTVTGDVSGDLSATGSMYAATFAAGDGTAAAPSFTIGTDDNTGMYSGGNGVILWSINAAQRMELTASGLDVDGDVTADAFVGSGAGLTSLGAAIPTTYGAVGTPVMAVDIVTVGSIAAGTEKSGANLRPADSNGVYGGSALSGTWRAMGRVSATGFATLWVRVS